MNLQGFGTYLPAGQAYGGLKRPRDEACDQGDQPGRRIRLKGSRNPESALQMVLISKDVPQHGKRRAARQLVSPRTKRQRTDDALLGAAVVPDAPKETLPLFSFTKRVNDLKVLYVLRRAFDALSIKNERPALTYQSLRIEEVFDDETEESEGENWDVVIDDLCICFSQMKIQH